MKNIIGIMLAMAVMLASCNKKHTEVTLSGSIQNDNIENVEIFISSVGEAPVKANLAEDGKSYSITLPSKESYFTYLMAVYTLKDGKGMYKEGQKMQIYTPVYITPYDGTLKIDIAENNDKHLFVAHDSNNRILSAYYQDFFINHMRHQPEFVEKSLTEYVCRISEYADSLSGEAESDEVKGFLKLRGYFDRIGATSMIEHRLKGMGKEVPAGLKEGMAETKDVVNNPAVKFFPQEITSLVMRDIAVGESVSERIANLKAGVSDTSIVSLVKNQLINRFVSSYDFSKGAEYGFAVLDSIAKDNPNYENWKTRLQKRSASVAGAPAPSIEILDAEGKAHTLAEFKGKYIYVDFWASWCGPCNREIPFMKELEKTLGNDNVVFVGISIDEDASAWKEAMKRHNLSENQFLGNKELAEMLSIQSIPRYLIYDKEGKLLNGNAPRPSSGEEIRSILKNLK